MRILLGNVLQLQSRRLQWIIIRDRSAVSAASGHGNTALSVFGDTQYITSAAVESDVVSVGFACGPMQSAQHVWSLSTSIRCVLPYANHS